MTKNLVTIATIEVVQRRVNGRNLFFCISSPNTVGERGYGPVADLPGEAIKAYGEAWMAGRVHFHADHGGVE